MTKRPAKPPHWSREAGAVAAAVFVVLAILGAIVTLWAIGAGLL